MHFGWNRRVACAAAVGALAWGSGVPAGAAPALPGFEATADGAEAFDDPKLSRELRRGGAFAPQPTSPVPPPRALPPVKGPAASPPNLRQPSPTGAPPVPSTAPPPVVPSTMPSTMPSTTPTGVALSTPPAVSPVLVPLTLALATPRLEAHGPADVVVVKPAVAAPSPSVTAPAPAPAAAGPWPYAPRMKLGYRRFPFTRLGEPSTTTPITLGPGASQSFESVSLDLYPISWYLRVGLSTQFGWESGQFDRSGDYFVAESASVGFQLPGRFTPFIEGLAGGGYMRRLQADKSVPTAYWQLGIDAGVEIYFANRAYGSLAVGYLHPANLFLMQQTLMSVKADTWSLKIAIGI